jgi:hypothetical protein
LPERPNRVHSQTHFDSDDCWMNVRSCPKNHTEFTLKLTLTLMIVG